LIWITFALLLLSRGLLPYLDTANRMIASGFATGTVIILSCSCWEHNPGGQPFPSRLVGIRRAGIGRQPVRPAAHRLLRLGLFPGSRSGWSGILLGLLLGGMLTQLDLGSSPAEAKKATGVTTAILGFSLYCPGLFCLSAPDVIARWTEGNYTIIVVAVSLLATGWVVLLLVAHNCSSVLIGGSCLPVIWLHPLPDRNHPGPRVPFPPTSTRPP